MPFWGQGDPPPPFWGHEPVPHVDATTTARAVEAGARVVDVGHPADWYAGHVPHALLVEPELLDTDLAAVPKERPIIVAGRDQGMAESIVASLRHQGYDAAVLDGGVTAWRASGRKLERVGR